MNKNVAIKIQSVSKVFSTNSNSARFVIERFLPKKFHDKKYEVIVLDNMNFEIEKGDFVGIIGKNGCGKSTLLKLISNVYVPNSGEIIVNGSIVPFLELGIGFRNDLTARDNVYINAAILGMTRKYVNSKFEEIFEFAGVERFMDQRLKYFSSGMRVRLAFAIAIQSKGDIFLLDEVLAVGDREFKRKSMEKMKELLAKKCTVIMTSHNENHILKNCNKVIYIEQGKIKYMGRDIKKGVDLYRKDVR